jgi:hypothetical protein
VEHKSNDALVLQLRQRFYLWRKRTADATVTLPTGFCGRYSCKTVTISGTPTASGTYTITTSGHTAAATTISGTVTRNLATIVLTSGTQSQRYALVLQLRQRFTLGGSATDATVTNLPTGLTSV